MFAFYLGKNSTNRNVNGMIPGKDSELALIPKLMYLSRVKSSKRHRGFFN